MGRMPAAKIAISIDPNDLRQLDELVRRGVAASRSQIIQQAVRDRLARLNRRRLAEECAKLDPHAERAEAESWFASKPEWPAYWRSPAASRPLGSP
jgi:Arc/MetJ-type ribon-helix-helix transcriptional regulator